MSTLAERIKEAMTHAGMTSAELARAAGVKAPSVAQWIGGRTKSLKASTANAAAAALGVSVRWLVEGEGPMIPTGVRPFDPEDEPPEKFVAIPLYRIRFGAGASPGEPTYEEVSESEPRYFSRHFLQSRHVSAHNLRCFKVHGTSMEPLLWDGDVILVDCAYQPILDGRVYAFTYNGEMRVKRLFKRMSGSIIIRSDNPDKGAYPDEELSGADLDPFHLVGRVIDRSGNGNL